MNKHFSKVLPAASLPIAEGSLKFQSLSRELTPLVRSVCHWSVFVVLCELNVYVLHLYFFTVWATSNYGLMQCVLDNTGMAL